MEIPERRCGSCGLPIYWLKHERTGKPAPIEVRQSDRGNVAVNLTQGTYAIVPKDERPLHAGWLHLNHFAECPQAPIWANAGKGA